MLRPSWSIVSTAQSPAKVLRFRPESLLRVVLTLMLIGQLGRIPVLSTGTSEAPILVNDVLLLVLLGVAVIGWLAADYLRADWIVGLVAAFVLVGFAAALRSASQYGMTGMQLVISLAYLGRWVVYFAVYLVVINVVSADGLLPLWSTLEGMILAFAAFGILQAIFLPHFAQLVYPDSRLYIDWDEQGHRLVSTVLEPNIAGSLIMIVLLVQLAQLANGERVPSWKPFLLFAALIATLSRSSMLGLAVGGVLIVSVRGISRRMMRFGIALGVLLLAAIPKLIMWAEHFGKLSLSDASAMSRVVNWLRALRIWADHPVFGIGFNTYGYVAERYGAVRSGSFSFSSDGGLLFIAVMTGLVGLLLYVGVLVLVLRRCRSIWRDQTAPTEWRSLAVGIAASTVAICVHGMFVNSLLTPFVMEPLWILWAMPTVMALHAPRTSTPALPVQLVMPRSAA
jgi:hypothetical protein